MVVILCALVIHNTCCLSSIVPELSHIFKRVHALNISGNENAPVKFGVLLRERKCSSQVRTLVKRGWHFPTTFTANFKITK